MPRGRRRVIHWGPGGEGDGFACGPGGGYYSTNWERVTCSDCLAQKPDSPLSLTCSTCGATIDVPRAVAVPHSPITHVGDDHHRVIYGSPVSGMEGGR